MERNTEKNKRYEKRDLKDVNWAFNSAVMELAPGNATLVEYNLGLALVDTNE